MSSTMKLLALWVPSVSTLLELQCIVSGKDFYFSASALPEDDFLLKSIPPFTSIKGQLFIQSASHQPSIDLFLAVRSTSQSLEVIWDDGMTSLCSLFFHELMAASQSISGIHQPPLHPDFHLSALVHLL